MRVLVISRAPWRNDNNTGNTLTDFFRDIPEFEIYSLCMREQLPQNDISLRNFYISEKQLMKNLISKNCTVGAENSCTDSESDSSQEKKMYDTAKKHSNYFLYFAREVLWSIGRWKNDNLRQYISEINPDIIFFPVFGCFYPHKILQYIVSVTSAKVVLFHADDNYSCRQFHVSPIYWLYRLILRKWVRKSVSVSDLNYVISDVQKNDYDKAFRKEHKILTKFAEFPENALLKEQYGNPLQLVFTGNININRWKTLSLIANVLKRVNEKETKAELRIYTATPITKRMKKHLDVPGSSYLMGSVPADEISKIQMDADLLVHVEALDLKNRLAVRQSFSTKIVDYLKAARPILAVGPKEVASIKHLIENECAVVADNENELMQELLKMFRSTRRLQELAQKAYTCGKCFHNRKDMSLMLMQDFRSVLE